MSLLIETVLTVRIKRCGGCCTSERMECVPTKLSKVRVRRTSVRIRRSTPSAVSETIQLDVHESCQCQCKIKESECDSSKHVYENCNCNCKNTEEQLNCIKTPTKIWDVKECACKCKNAYHCSTGLVYSHNTCR